MRGASLIVGIDAGYRNLGVCALRSDALNAPQLWACFDLVAMNRLKGTPDPGQLVQMTHKWCTEQRAILEAAEVIVLEKQMRTPFHVINSVIHALHPQKCVYFSPQTIGAFWKLPRKREQKKAAAVALVKQMCCFRNSAWDKRDDLADAFLLALFFACQAGHITREECLTFENTSRVNEQQ